MNERIEEFINEHHVLTFAAAAANEVWCASTFYTFDKLTNSFIVTSNNNTKHITLALSSPQKIVAGNIALETEEVGKIRGLQFTAKLINAQALSGTIFNRYKLLYLSKFPYAILKGGEVWILQILTAKLTDNRLGFGKKLYWERDEKNPSKI